MRRRLKLLLRNFLYAFALIILLVGLLFALARGFTFALNLHKDWFEGLTTRLIGQPVLVDKVQASFNGIIPEFNFYKVVVLTSAEKSRPLLNLTSLHIGIDIPRTLWQRHLVANAIFIEGATVTVKITADGKFNLNGQSLEAAENMPLLSDGWLTPNAITVAKWILSQQLISLNDITLRVEQPNKASFNLSNLNFTLVNRGQSHRLRSVAKLVDRKNPAFTLAADLKGNIEQRDSWFGSVYWQGSNLALETWFKQLGADLQLEHGVAAATLWLDIKHGNLSSAQTQFKLTDLALTATPQTHRVPLTALSGSLSWHTNFDGSWSLATRGWQWIDKQRHWSLDNLILTIDAAHTSQSIYWPQLDLPSWQSWIAANTWLPSQVTSLWQQYKPQGHLQQLAILHTSAWPELSSNTMLQDLLKNLYLRTKFEQFGLQAVDKLPGVTQLKGELILRPGGGTMRLDSALGNIELPNLFAQPVLFTQLSGEIQWQQQKAGWYSKLININFKNELVDSWHTGSIFFPTAHHSPNVNIVSHFKQDDSTKLKALLPSKIMPPTLVSWLQNAFTAGDGNEGAMVMRGRLADFPYAVKPGQFIVDMQVNNLTLHYAAGWPSIEQLSGRLRFDPSGMYFNVSHGNFSGHALAHTQVTAPAVLSHATLVKVHTQATLDMGAALGLTQTTPLQKPLAALHNMQAKGSGQLALNLQIPLHRNQAEKLVVDGKLTLTDAIVVFPKLQLVLKKIYGTLNFTAHTLYAKAMQASLFNRAATIDIATLSAPSGAIKRFTIDSQIDVTTLKKRYTFFPLPYLQGSARYHSVLDFLDKGQGQHVQINSNLQGISVDLPPPYGKLASTKKAFKLQAKLTTNNRQLNLAYLPEVSASFYYLSAVKNVLQRGVIKLGKGTKMKLPTENGLIVMGTIPMFNWAQWEPYWHVYSAHAKQSMPAHKTAVSAAASPGLLRLVDIKLGQVTAFNQTINKAAVKIYPRNHMWQTDINSSDLSGQVVYSNNFSKQPILANFSRVYLQPPSPQNKVTSTHTTATVGASILSALKPQQVPAIKVSIDDFHYGERQFGGVKLNLRPNKSEVKFDAAVDSSSIKAKASGYWRASGQHSSTALAGTANFINLGAGLKAANLADNLVDGKGKLNFRLSWPAAPWDPDKKTLRGSADLNLARGRVIGFTEQINRKIGLGKFVNMLGVESLLQHLHRNSSDAARSSGYSFNSWQGNYEFISGKMRTKNTAITGTVANIYLTGEIDAVKENYDLIVKITPYATSSVPLILTLLGGPIGPILGIAATATNRLVVDKITENTYKITGPWDEPHMTKLAK